MKNQIGTLVLFLAGIASFAYSQKSADFIILDKPSIFTILNQYQQLLSSKEKNEFAIRSPLQIATFDETLGDQITRVLKANYGGETYYLQKDEAGKFLGDAKGLSYKIMKHCAIVNDTIIIAMDNAVPFSERQFGSGQSYLQKGESVVRVFFLDKSCYVQRLKNSGIYGWSIFTSEKQFRKDIEVTEKYSGMSALTQDKIMGRIKTANESYKLYFNHFEKQTGTQKTVPYWTCETKNAIIHCYLNNPYRYGLQLSESTQYLVRDLANMLIGKQYDISVLKGDITIKPKSEKK